MYIYKHFNFLCQGGHLLPGVFLFVFLLATSRKNFCSDLHENFIKDVSLNKESTVSFWYSLRPYRRILLPEVWLQFSLPKIIGERFTLKYHRMIDWLIE